MLLTILIAAGVTVVLSATFAVIAKVDPLDVLASETTLSGSASASDTAIVGRTLTQTTAPAWNVTTISNLHDAEELLDMLENQGFAERELVLMGNACFAVRCAEPTWKVQETRWVASIWLATHRVSWTDHHDPVVRRNASRPKTRLPLFPGPSTSASAVDTLSEFA